MPGSDLLQIGEALRPEDQVADDEQRPALADEVERVGDSAELTVASAWGFRSSLPINKFLLAFYKSYRYRSRSRRREETSMSTGVQTQVGRIVWHELMSTDAEAAKRFYTELLGWELEMWKTGEMDYAMVKVNGQDHGGFHQLEDDQGTPSHWMASRPASRMSMRPVSRAEKAGARFCSARSTFPRSGALR